jgi:hypothetical protein
MNPQLTTYYMAQQTNRTRLDRLAYQGSLAAEAPAGCNCQPVVDKAASNGAKHIGRRWQDWVARPATIGMGE